MPLPLLYFHPHPRRAFQAVTSRCIAFGFGLPSRLHSFYRRICLPVLPSHKYDESNSAEGESCCHDRQHLRSLSTARKQLSVLSKDREYLGVHTKHADLLADRQPAIHFPQDCVEDEAA
jgi:hypothetical protein